MGTMNHDKALKAFMSELELHVMEHLTERARLRLSLQKVHRLWHDSCKDSDHIPPDAAHILRQIDRLAKMLDNS